MDLVFVYGTLMPGEPLWPVLAPYALSWRDATAAGRIWDTGRGYPAVRFDVAGEVVPGVLVTLDPGQAPAAIAALDEVEEVGELYRRVEVAAAGARAWAYEWLGPTDGLEPLPGGWRRLPPAQR